MGDDGYAKALDLYFDRHDGDAATIEDWLKVFEDATGRDLTQFARWYSQAGTPRLRATEDFNDGTYTLHFEQETPATPGQPDKAPLVIPIALGLLNPNGDEVLPTTVVEMTEARQSFTFDGLAAKPVPSLLRNFSAPVILDRDSTAEERAFLLAHDTDPFNKWEAGRQLAKDVLTAMVTDGAAPGPAYLDALERVTRDDSLDPAFRALALALPSEDDLAQTLFDAGVTPDPTAIHEARERVADTLARRLENTLPEIYEAMNLPGPYTPDPKAAGCRSLRLTALGLLTRLDGGERANALYHSADNMTEELGALACLLQAGNGDEAVARFYRRWSHDRLVMDKWFALQIARAKPDRAAAKAAELARHPDFDWKNPNRFRAVLGALSGNTAGFHHPSGEAYGFVADWLIKLDPLNPQTTARMTTMFETWARYDADRQGMIREALQRIARTPNLSRDTTEMVSRILGT